MKASSIMPEFSFREKAADIYLLQGNEKLARQAYAEVISMLGEDERSGHTVNLELSRVYSKLGNYSKAKEYAMREYRQRPENIDVNGSLAWISFKEGDNVSAEKFMVHALRTGTKDPETLWRASRISSASGKATESERLLAVMKTTNSIFDPIHQ
ncbi:MAG: hypothetical protein EOP49_17225 [Sphingobacteriales bacterium]|nr:MAG: hypothetical protein EOP49_17225 [Sphingobacteriales bacterium]